MAKKSKLLPSVRAEIRRKNYSSKTEKNYCGWIKRYIHFHDLKHPKGMSEKRIISYLSYLANKRNVAVLTPNQALCAIINLVAN